MNCSFRLVWSVAKGLWVVASELVKGKTKSRSIKLMTSSLKKGLPCLAISGLIAHSSMSFAAGFYTWTGTESNADGWNLEVSNWDKGSVPSSSDDVSLNGTVSATGNAISMDRLYMGTTSLAKLTISNGAANSIAQDAYVGNVASQNGFLYLKNSGTSLTVGNLNIGRYGIGTVDISDGATLSVSGSLIIALKANSTGTLNIGSAAGQTASAAGFLSNAASITFDPTGSASASTLVLNHTNTDYQLSQNLVDSTGNSNIYLYSGTTSFTGTTSGYKGTMNVDGGTLSIADGETLTLGGNYNQTAGTLKVGASSLTNFGKLKVTGTAAFAKDSKITVDVTKVNSLAAGTMTKVVEAGTLKSDGFVVTDNSALLDFTASVDGNNVNLIAVQGTDNSASPDDTASPDNKVTVLKYVQNLNFTTGFGAARVLDVLRSRGVSTGTSMDAVVTALNQLPFTSDGKAVSNAVAETLPLLQGATSQVASTVMQSTSRIIQTRQSVRSGLSSGDDFIADKHGWVKTIGNWAKQNSLNGSAGYSANSYGIIGGFDGDLNDTSTLGLALSYVNSSVDGKAEAQHNSADIDAYQIALYGEHQLERKNLNISWQADAGLNQTDGTRHITFMNKTAHSSYNSYTGHVGAGLGRIFAISNSTSVEPSIHVDYSYIKNESYTETGADSLNLNVNSNHTDAFVVSLQSVLDHSFNDQISMSATFGVGYDVINDDTSLTSSYVGGGAAFTTPGLNQDPWVVTAGANINYAISELSRLTVSYDVQGKEHFLSQTASAKVRWLF